MKIRIQIAMEGNNGEFERIENIVDLERSLLQPETLGLTLAESKTVLQGIQECMVSEQVKEYMAQFNTCPDWGSYHVSVKSAIFAGASQHKIKIAIKPVS